MAVRRPDVLTLTRSHASARLYYGDSYSVISGVTPVDRDRCRGHGGNARAIVASGGTGGQLRHHRRQRHVERGPQATLTVTANNPQSKTYGGADPTLTYTSSGTLYYGDAYSVITGVGLSTTTGAAATAGTHAIVASGGTAANYAITYVNGTLSVAQAALTVTANNQSKTYGGADPTLTDTPSGTLYYGDTYAVISGVSLATTTGAAATAGTHAIIALGGTAANYAITDVNGMLTVAQAALTVTADPQSKTYGGADPALTYTPSGTLYYSDTYAVISGVSLSTATGAAAMAGTHTITASGGTATNYAITDVNGTLTVSKAPLTVTADNKSKVYGAADPTLTYTPSGTLYYGDTYSVITGVTLFTATGAAATAGTHTITAGGTTANYAITDVNGTLTVSKAAALTVTADNKSKVYGAADPTLTYTPSGTLYYGDTYAVISGVSLSTTTGAAATAGTHTITASGGTAANYAITDVNGTLTVSQAALTVTADNKSKVYGAADPTLTDTPSGTLYYGDTYAVISGVTLATATGAAATAGTHTITASGGTAANYAITDVDGTLTVSKAAALTVTADNKSKVYGAADPTLTYTPSGTLYYTDTYAVITGVSLATATGAAATAGTHAIIATGGTAANYAITDVNGTLTVAQAALTVTADNQSKTYGGADPTLTYTASGTLYYTDTYAVISGVSLSTATGAAATAGTHAIVASGGTAANYAITDVNGTLSVAQAALTVTANNQSKTYGGADPTLTYTASGTLYYSDTYAVISGVTLSTTTGAAATAGTHTITATGGTAANYAITDVNGTLSVAQAALTVTANNQSKTYGGADPTLTYTPSGTLYYADTYAVISGVCLSTTTGAAATAGTHAIVASGGTAANYAITDVNGTLNVAQASLTVTADNQSKTYGGADPTLTYTASGTLYYTDTYAVISGVTLSTTTGATATAGHARHRRQRRHSGQLRHHRRERHVERGPGVADGHGQQPEQDLRRCRPDADLHGQRYALLHRHLRGHQRREPVHRDRCRGDGWDARHRRQRRHGGQLRHHRRQRHVERGPGGADGHGQQPEQDLRRRRPDADLHGQRHALLHRHLRGHQRREPVDRDRCRGDGRNARHRRQRRYGGQLRHHRRQRHVERGPGNADGHGRQPVEGLRCGVADINRHPQRGRVQRRHHSQLRHFGDGQQRRYGQRVRHHADAQRSQQSAEQLHGR